MKTLRRIYLVLTILLGIVGIVQCVRWSNFAPISFIFLINLLPFTFFLTAYLVSTKIERVGFHIVAIPLCLLAFCLTSFAGYVVEIINVSTTDVTDVVEYKTILNESWYPSELASHFPSDIPPDARKVRFSYRPHFLQGGSHIQLRYTTSPEEISALSDRFSKMKTKSYFVGKTKARGILTEGMPTRASAH